MSPGSLDRAAEHVADHQHEDHGLNRREHQQLRRAAVSNEIPLRDRIGVSHQAQGNAPVKLNRTISLADHDSSLDHPVRA
jgi:hypothetical protein